MIKKFLFSLLMIFSIFFVNDNVFAVSLDSLRESYTNVLMTSCTYLGDENDDSCGTLDTEDNPITNKTFRDVLDIVGITHTYFVEMRGYDISNNEITKEYDYIYLFNTPMKIGRFTQKFGGAKYYDDYYYFAPNINSTDSCYIFQYLPSESESYDYMKMYYSSNCITDRDAYTTDGDSLTGRYIYRPYVFYSCPNGNDDISTCYKTHDFIIKVTNFDLYDFEDNLYQDSNVKDDIVVPDETINSSTSTGIWGTLKDIFNSIVNLPSIIIDGISSIFEWLIDRIVEILQFLFIPNDTFLNDWFEDLRNSFEKQLGFLSYPITWILEVLNMFLTLDDSGSYLISWSSIKVPNFDFVIIESGSFDLATLLENETLKMFHDLYLIVIDSLMLLSFFNLCLNTFNRIIGSDVQHYDYLSVDEGYLIDDTGTVQNYTKFRHFRN